jgi:hypothetical protein
LTTLLSAGLELEVVDEGVRWCGEACQRVMGCIERAQPELEGAVSGRFGEVQLRKQLLGRVIGPAGSNIKALERSTGSPLPRVCLLGSFLVMRTPCLMHMPQHADTSAQISACSLSQEALRKTEC